MYPRTYWQTLLGSLSSPGYYQEIMKKSWWFSLRFFIISLILIGLILSGVIIKIRLPEYRQQFEQAVQEATANFPAALEISWDKSQLTLNQTEPLVVAYPSSYTKPTEFPEKALIIAPALESGENLSQNLPFSALAVVTDNQLLVTDFRGNWSEVALSDLPGFDQPFVLNQATLPEFKQTAIKMIDQGFRITQQILPVVLPVMIVISQLTDSFFYAVIGFFSLRLFTKTLAFTKVWQICLHLTIIAYSISQLANYLYRQNFIFLYPATFWILFTLIIWSLKKQPLR